MQTAKEIISGLNDKELKDAVMELNKASRDGLDFKEGIVLSLAKKFRDELNITEVNTLVLTRNLIINEAAQRWLKTIE